MESAGQTLQATTAKLGGWITAGIFLQEARRLSEASMSVGE
jgi:hypothetical protein